ncbi:MAG: helix-turn-helix domain-containing protein [Beijerinckiaceae bacterium]
MTASTLLRSARRASGLSQVELAARAKTSQPEVSSVERGRRVPTVETLERLLREAGFRIVAVPLFAVDADETAERIAEALLPGSRDDPLRAFLDYSDTLVRSSDVDRVLLSAREPRSTGSRDWDAALAALVDYRLGPPPSPRPDWITASSRHLDTPGSPQLGPYDLEPDRDEVPEEFLRRNVLIERSTLASV